MKNLTVRPRSSHSRPGIALSALACLTIAGCARFGAVYPPRPAGSPGPASTDPAPARLVVHVSVTRDGLRAALDAAVPRTGEGTLPLLGGQRTYTWTRQPLTLRMAQGRLVIGLHVDARVALPVRSVELPFDLDLAAEPVMSRDYALKLQSVEVKVSSNDRRLEVANAVGGVFDALGQAVRAQLDQFAYDVRPLVLDGYGRLARPMRFPVGDAEACARVAVLGVEAGPTVLADGLEKDLALLVAPQVTLPCGDDPPLPPLPPLANVAALPAGPFTLSVPIAASYDELAHAMTAAFTGGKLFFSKDYPQLFMENPELYESQGLLVLKLHMKGPVHAMGIDAELDGDIFFSGHPSVADNELSIPDLEPTIETTSLLLSLKAATGAAAIRDQARAALRLDLGARLKLVRSSLEGDLRFGGNDACVRGSLDKVEVASVFPHGSYLRLYVNVTGRADATLPCAFPALASPAPGSAPSPAP
jgi:hypothetical protein